MLSALSENNMYSCVVHHIIGGEQLKLRFAIQPVDYLYLKKILEFKPFENTGVAPYRYFFALAYGKGDDENSARMSVRVEQLNDHKQYTFTISRKFISNLLWFNSLTDKKEVMPLIEE